MNNYKDLKLWQKSVDGCGTYKVTNSFQKEMYGLTFRLRSAFQFRQTLLRCRRNTKKDFNNFLGISTGSSCELDTQLINCKVELDS